MAGARHNAGLRYRLGTSLALLALLGQLVLGTLVPKTVEPTLAALFPWAGIICHGGPAAPAPASHHHSLPGWAVCPFCLALSVPLPNPSASARVPARSAAWIAWRPLPPPARAPPARHPTSAQPRGPPTLIRV